MPVPCIAEAGNLPGATNGGNAYIKNLFNDGASRLGKYIDDADTSVDILKIIANDRFLSGMLIAQDIGKAAGRESQEIADALRRFHCLPSSCNMGGAKAASLAKGGDGKSDAMLEFFDMFGKMADHQVAGKTGSTAWASLSKVISDMGQVQRRPSKKSIVNTAKGATANFAEIVLSLNKEGTILNAAEEAIDTVLGNATLKHIADHKVTRTGPSSSLKVNREVKEWSAETIDRYLWMSFKGEMPPDGAAKAGQFYQDILNMMQRGVHKDLSKVDYEWVFVHGNPDDIIGGIVGRLLKDNTRLLNLAENAGDSNLEEILSNKNLRDNYINLEFSSFLEKIIVNAKAL